MASAQPIVIAIEGLIGAGKSTLLNYLKTNLPNVLYIEEPVELFQEYKRFNPLGLLHSDAFACQYYIISTLVQYYSKFQQTIQSYDIIITERCFDSPIVFSEALYLNKCMSEFGHELLKDVFSKEKEKVAFPTVSGIFYLARSPETCFERVKIRNRTEEQHLVNISYLKNLERAYHNYFHSVKIPLWYSAADTNEPRKLLDELQTFIHNVQR